MTPTLERAEVWSWIWALNRGPPGISARVTVRLRAESEPGEVEHAGDAVVSRVVTASLGAGPLTAHYGRSVALCWAGR